MSDPLEVRPENLDEALWEAFIQHRDTFLAAHSADRRNLSAIIGFAKEMCESLAKIVLVTRGETMGSAAKYPNLISTAHEKIGLHPKKNLASDSASRAIAQSLMSLATSLGELRLNYGIGHGRAEVVYATEDHAELAIDAAQAWCRYVLRRLPVFLLGNIDPIIAKLRQGIWHRGDLVARFDAIDWQTISTEDARRLGIAVGHRTINATFSIRFEGVELVMAEPERVNDDYIAGVVHGLLISADGTLTTTKVAIGYVVGLLAVHTDPAAVVADVSSVILNSNWREAHEAPDPLTEVIVEARRLTGSVPQTARAAWADMWPEVERLLVLGHPF